MPFRMSRVFRRLPSTNLPRKTLTQAVVNMEVVVVVEEEEEEEDASTLAQPLQPPIPVTLNPDSLGLGSDYASCSHRRSLRLASKSNPVEICPSSSATSRHRRRSSDLKVEVTTEEGGLEINLLELKNVDGVLEAGELGTGVRVSDSQVDVGEVAAEGSKRQSKKKGKRKSGDFLDLSGGLAAEEWGESGLLSLRSGTKIMKGVSKVGKDGAGFDESGNSGSVVDDDLAIKREELIWENDKGKGILFNVKEESDAPNMVEDSTIEGERELAREVKGKGKMVYDDPAPSNGGSDDLKIKRGFQFDLNVPAVDIHGEWPSVMMNAGADAELLNVARVPRKARSTCFITLDDPYLELKNRKQEHFKQVARENAARFAHFDAEEEDQFLPGMVTSSSQWQVPSEQKIHEVEDWPGPFSTAMKIIQDREKKARNHEKNLTIDNDGALAIKWSPCQRQDHEQKKPVPLLQDLCISVLVENADAISSLEFIPDAIRHKLSQMLCDSRKINAKFFDLLTKGSPSEIGVRDCSWMTEEQFARSFEGCDPNNLTVLQLDQCGRCMPDYTVLATLGRKRLPALMTISLKGACRLSDVGLGALVSSAPSLRSINLSQCSLLTDVGINSMANSLESNLCELYLDDCQTLDVMHVLPSFKKLKHLQVLSLAGIPSVRDQFVMELISAIGDNIKELNLSDCVKLTDSSMKIIAENCSAIRALSVVNLCKLTDLGIGYLANGLQAIESLKFCRNKFSDKAVAAFLETCGESLKELSLNNVGKVSYHTALSLAKRCRNLESLDLSWCRNLTDEALGLIADSCFSLSLLRLFGCTQVSRKFLDGHSNPNLQVIGLKLTPILDHIKEPNHQQGPLSYSSAPCVI